MIFLAVCYVLGAVVTAGVIGGIREEMDGLGDLAIIILWPLSLIVFIIYRVARSCYRFGRWLGGWPKNVDQP